MKELKECEGKVDSVKGTNLTQEELGTIFLLNFSSELIFIFSFIFSCNFYVS
jgi:hypothetical protein